MINYRDEYAYFRKEILAAQKTGNCFHMANEECSLILLKEGQDEFPELIMYQIGSIQFLCVNNMAKQKFKEFLQNRINKKKDELLELYEVLEAVRAEGKAERSSI